jgi:hypothetical protein
MADGFQAKADTTGAIAGIDRLKGPIAKHLARSMAVAGGTVYRDEAKVLVSVKDGVLRDAIYLAYKQGRSTDQDVTYSITWNSRKAPHGHLQEFGHWRVYATYIGNDGTWYTNRNVRLPEPKWVPAHPFLRPAFDSAAGRAHAAMIERARQRLPELLRDAYQPPDEDFV